MHFCILALNVVAYYYCASVNKFVLNSKYRLSAMYLIQIQVCPNRQWRSTGLCRLCNAQWLGGKGAPLRDLQWNQFFCFPNSMTMTLFKIGCLICYVVYKCLKKNFGLKSKGAHHRSSAQGPPPRNLATLLQIDYLRVCRCGNNYLKCLLRFGVLFII